ncbi:mCG144821, partial [Mus musculus]
ALSRKSLEVGGSKGGVVRTTGESALSGRRKSHYLLHGVGLGGNNLHKVHSFSGYVCGGESVFLSLCDSWVH